MEIIKRSFLDIIALIVLFIYLITLAPSVIQIDTGELAAVQYTLGIAHPTGYPLFTILGYLFLSLPLGLSKIYQANLLATLYCTGAIFVFGLSFRSIIQNLHAFTSSKKEVKKVKHKKEKVQHVAEVKAEINPWNVLIAVVSASFALAFSRTFWFQALSTEVYSLHLLLISFIIFFLIKAFIEKEVSIKTAPAKAWILFSVFLALGFTNHMTTLLILPAVAVLYFIKYGFNKTSFMRLAIMIAIFMPVLVLVYLYLPLRASSSPIINWGNPVDWERIMRHVSGKQYQVWLFASSESAKENLVYFFETLPKEFYLMLLPVIAGMFYSFKNYRKLFFFLLTAFLSTVLYSINYDINDLDSYFLLAYIALAFFVLIGVYSLLLVVKNESSKYALVGALTLFVGVSLVKNYETNDQSEVYVFEDYTKAVVNSVGKNALVLSYQWDYFISASYYFQNVENFRKDVKIIDKELLRRSWYFIQLEKQHPGIFKGLESTIAQFQNALVPFERDEQFNPELLETLYRNILTGLIEEHLKKGDVYLAPEMVEKELQNKEFALPEGCTIVPDLFLYKVVKTKDYSTAGKLDFNIRYSNTDNIYHNFIKNNVNKMLTFRKNYELSFNKQTEAASIDSKLMQLNK